MESTIRIERYADQGRCVGHIDGRVVFVRFALPGELVRVVLDEPHDREDRFWTGEVTEVLEASEDRVEPVWPLAGPLAMGGGVGGADLVHVSLPGQLKWKSTSIAEQMRRLGHVDVDVPIERMPEDEAEQGLHWRTRIEMIADENGRPSMRRTFDGFRKFVVFFGKGRFLGRRRRRRLMLGAGSHARRSFPCRFHLFFAGLFDRKFEILPCPRL